MSSGNNMPDASGWFWSVALGLAIMIVLGNLGGCVWSQ